MEKEKNSHRICDINNRHKSAKEMLSQGVTPQQFSDQAWKILYSNRQEQYVIEQITVQQWTVLAVFIVHFVMLAFICSTALVLMQIFTVLYVSTCILLKFFSIALLLTY